MLKLTVNGEFFWIQHKNPQS